MLQLQNMRSQLRVGAVSSDINDKERRVMHGASENLFLASLRMRHTLSKSAIAYQQMEDALTQLEAWREHHHGSAMSLEHEAQQQQQPPPGPINVFLGGSRADQGPVDWPGVGAAAQPTPEATQAAAMAATLEKLSKKVLETTSGPHGSIRVALASPSP